MKFKLRFFLDEGQERTDQFCFATMRSGYAPSYGDKIFIGDDSIVDKTVEPSGLYQITDKVYVYNSNEPGTTDDLTSVEISVKRINK